MKLKEQSGAAGGSPARIPKPTPQRQAQAPAFPKASLAAEAATTFRRASVGGTLFAGSVGLWLGLALLKFGNPVVLELHIEPPTNWLEFVLVAWPISWGYWLLVGLVLASLPFWRWHVPTPKWLVALPLVWFIWQVCSGIQTVDPSLTKPVLAHFASCVAGFYLGLFALSSLPQLRLFWIGLFGAFLLVLIVGWQQHFGGLEETRRVFYQLPNWQEFPPEYVKRLSSNRIYSTLFYPNTLAGVIILLLPALLAALWQLPESVGGKWGFSIGGGLGGLACLYWSGSKAGWLIALALGMVALMHLKFSLRIKLAISGAIALVGLAGFLMVYSGYFSRGATSVSARMDYWKAGWTLMLEKPILGSGPGTYLVGYQRLKASDAEMARLAHNDYLQQGADSGVPGMLLYSVVVGGLLCRLYRDSRSDPMRLGLWLGVLGVALQSFVEFGLYNPATAWPQFLLMGWLLGSDRTRSEPVNSVA